MVVVVVVVVVVRLAFVCRTFIVRLLAFNCFDCKLVLSELVSVCLRPCVVDVVFGKLNACLIVILVVCRSCYSCSCLRC